MNGLDCGARGWPPLGAPASQDASHVGHAGVRVFSLRGAPLSLPFVAAVQFQFF